MISKEEAIHLIKSSSCYDHALIVSTIMWYFADLLGEDKTTWELVGLLHDLDFNHVQNDMTQHGIVASETLKGKLPNEARHAVRSHDYRAGVKPHSTLDKALIIADSLATILADLSGTLTSDRFEETIERLMINTPWLIRNIQRSSEIGITQQALVDLVVDIHNKMQQWIRVCPQCFSPCISPQAKGFWAWSTQRYSCQDCHYSGSNFVEIKLDELERITDLAKR